MAGPPRLAQSVLRVRHANDATSSEPGCRVSRRSRHHGGSEKARLKSARRCAESVAHFSSLGLVSGGLRKQAASFFCSKVVRQNPFRPAAELPSVIGPNPLPPVPITTRL